MLFLIGIVIYSCPVFSDEFCGNGYTRASTNDIASYSMIETRAGACDSGYQAYTANYDIAHPIARDLPMKCDSGYYYKNGTCVAYEQTSCDSGFLNNGQNSGSMFDYTYAGGCTGGMEPIQTSHVALRLVNTNGNSVRCGTGYYYKNGTCVAYERGVCEPGYFYETPAIQESAFNPTYSGRCLGGYDTILGRHYASYVTFGTTVKCGVGEYPTPTGCVAHPTENCPENYYAITPLNAFKRIAEDAICGTDYEMYYDTDLCRQYLGENMASVCTPQLICTHGATTLRTSTGLILPIYDERATYPAMHAKMADGNICYGNVVPGVKTGTINIKYNDTVYHVDK